MAGLLARNVTILTAQIVTALADKVAVLACPYSGTEREIDCDSFIPVTSREPQDALWLALQDAGMKTLERIGDARAPGLIGHAVHDGHRAGRAYMAQPEDLLIRRERVLLAGG